MADQTNNKPYEFFIPANYMESDRIFGFRKRNIGEAVIICLLIFRIVFWIPFVLKVKLIIAIVLSLAIGIKFLNGVHNRSVTEWFHDYLQYKKNGKQYHMRLPGIEGKDKIELYDEQGQRMSYAGALIKKAESRLDDGTRSKIENITGQIKERLKQ